MEDNDFYLRLLEQTKKDVCKDLDNTGRYQESEELSSLSPEQLYIMMGSLREAMICIFGEQLADAILSNPEMCKALAEEIRKKGL